MKNYLMFKRRYRFCAFFLEFDEFKGLEEYLFFLNGVEKIEEH